MLQDERERDDEGGGVPETTREEAAATIAKCNKHATLSAATSGPRWVYKSGPRDLLSLPPPSLPHSLNAVTACLGKEKR